MAQNERLTYKGVELPEGFMQMGQEQRKAFLLKNDLVNVRSKINKLPQKFKNQYLGFRDFIYKALVKKEIDRLIQDQETEDSNAENVIPISKNL